MMPRPNKQLLQTPQTLCGLLPCCCATAATVDMRRSIYEASFVKSGPLGKASQHGRGVGRSTVGLSGDARRARRYASSDHESQDPASIRVDASCRRTPETVRLLTAVRRHDPF